jgi:hypothetical protein
MLAVIYSDGDGAPISFPLGNDGVALVTSLRLSLRFHMSEDIMFIDEEVYDAQSGDLIHTIGKSPECDGVTKQWLLNAGRYQVYGVSDSVMAASTELVTSHCSSTGTDQLTPTTQVKLEHSKGLITILSDDSDGNSPTVAHPRASWSLWVLLSADAVKIRPRGRVVGSARTHPNVRVDMSVRADT